jgi:hypothetical protein
VLEDVVSLVTTAERLADRVTDLCRGGEPFDNELVELTSAVEGLASRCSHGLPPELHRRWLSLAERVATATAAAEARRQQLATELSQLAQQHRVRRAYVRPPA